jgi:hypothetical protein
MSTATDLLHEVIRLRAVLDAVRDLVAENQNVGADGLACDTDTIMPSTLARVIEGYSSSNRQSR